MAPGPAKNSGNVAIGHDKKCNASIYLVLRKKENSNTRSLRAPGENLTTLCVLVSNLINNNLINKHALNREPVPLNTSTTDF